MSEWRTIDSVPLSEEVMICDRGGTVHLGHMPVKAELIFWVGYDGYGNDICVSDATHWMPLPSPPKEKG